MLGQKHILPTADALVYIVDATDTQRLGEARDDLEQTLKTPTLSPTCPLLVLANKQVRWQHVLAHNGGAKAHTHTHTHSHHTTRTQIHARA